MTHSTPNERAINQFIKISNYRFSLTKEGLGVLNQRDETESSTSLCLNSTDYRLDPIARKSRPDIKYKVLHRCKTRYTSAPRVQPYAPLVITNEEREAMFIAQGGVCAICNKPPRAGRLLADHCHSSGVNRGLLCNLCNGMLGMAKDDIATLTKAITYLETAKNSSSDQMGNR